MRKLRVTLCLLVGLMVLTGCKTELYSNLSEREANDMVAALLASGIDANKVGIGDSLYTVSVEKHHVQDALGVLRAQGLPQQTRESIGQVFAKSGIVSSPFEERVRYVYALGEEVAQTLQEIDGVLVARVHIVMPEAAELGQEAKPSSAAVFIKQKVGFDLDFLVPQIRRLVANSIEGVQYEEVTVVLVEAQPQSGSQTTGPDIDMVQPLPGITLANSSVTMFWGMLGGAAAVALLLLVGLLLLVRSNVGLRARLATAEDMDA